MPAPLLNSTLDVHLADARPRPRGGVSRRPGGCASRCCTSWCWAGCCSPSTTSWSAGPTTRTPSSSAPRWTSEAQSIVQGRARPGAQRRGARGPAPRLARQRGALPRRPGAAGRQGRHGHPRARDLQGAERDRQQRQAAAARRQGCCATGSRATATNTTSRRATTSRRRRCPGDSSEAAVRAFVKALNGGTPGDAKAGLRVFKGRPHANLVQSYGAGVRPGAGTVAAGQVAGAADARRLAGHAAGRGHAAEAGRLRGPARGGAAGLDGRHRRRAAHGRRARAGQEVQDEARGPA